MATNAKRRTCDAAFLVKSSEQQNTARHNQAKRTSQAPCIKKIMHSWVFGEGEIFERRGKFRVARTFDGYRILKCAIEADRRAAAVIKARQQRERRERQQERGRASDILIIALALPALAKSGPWIDWPPYEGGEP